MNRDSVKFDLKTRTSGTERAGNYSRPSPVAPLTSTVPASALPGIGSPSSSAALLRAAATALFAPDDGNLESRQFRPHFITILS